MVEGTTAPLSVANEIGENKAQVSHGSLKRVRCWLHLLPFAWYIYQPGEKGKSTPCKPAEI